MTPPTPLASGIGGLCPRCAARTLFQGLVTFAPRCRACGLDFTSFNVGDGPAAFLVLLVGTLITGLAVWLELATEPSFWVHLLIWPALTLVLVVGSLRVAKGMLLTLEYRNAAREGRIVDADPR
jgi:uncharacterized protein (DUF983 family)